MFGFGKQRLLGVADIRAELSKVIRIEIPVDRRDDLLQKALGGVLLGIFADHRHKFNEIEQATLKNLCAGGEAELKEAEDHMRSKIKNYDRAAAVSLTKYVKVLSEPISLSAEDEEMIKRAMGTSE